MIVLLVPSAFELNDHREPPRDHFHVMSLNGKTFSR